MASAYLLTRSLLPLLLVGCLVNRELHDTHLRRVSGGTVDSDENVDCDPDGNLLVDGSFENFGSGQGISPWATTAGATPTVVEGTHCEWALRSNSTNYGGITQEVQPPVAAGTVLRLTGFVRHVDGANRSPGWLLYTSLGVDGDNTETAGITGYAGDGNWHAFTSQMTLPTEFAGTPEFARFTMQSGSADSSTFELDGLMLEVVE